MYEEMTYENIKGRILENTKTDLSKIEGSFLDIISSPVSMELNKAYTEFDKILSIVYLDECEGEYIDKRVNMYGIYRKKGTKASVVVTFTGVNGTIIPKGTLVQSNDGILFETIDAGIISQLTANIVAESVNVGINTNVLANTLMQMPISITGITSVINFENASGGANIETDEELINRFKAYMQNPVTGGNLAHYDTWADEFSKIGRMKKFPLWNGGNTIKLAITDRQYQPASTILVEEFQNYIDPHRLGLGNGKAPMGAKVTVTGGIEKLINISCQIKLNEGYSAVDGLNQAIINYFAKITFVKNSISYMQLGSAILDVESIADLSNLTINSFSGDIELEDEEIPVLGNLNVVIA